MIRLRRIVCPVDFSEFSRRALEHASVLARWYEAELVALHVVPLMPSLFPLVPGMSNATLKPLDLRAKGRALQTFAAGVVAKVRTFQSMVRSGSAAPVIVEVASEFEADLLVLGTHGRSGFQRLMLGSVTETVMRRAPCPVLTVPKAAETQPRGPVFHHVLCGVDFSVASPGALEYALSLAAETNGRLTLLHTIEWVPDELRPDQATFGVNLYRRSLLSEARARLAELVPAEARDWCQIDTRVACGEPSAEILRAAAAEGADLVVLGAGRPGPIDRMLFGSTTQKVVRQASCPVLTVRSGRERAENDGLDQTVQGAGSAEGRS